MDSTRIYKSVTLFIACMIKFMFVDGQVGVNILNPHSTAAMQVQSPSGTFKGLLTPTMTSLSRMNITIGTVTPADGLMVYDTEHKMHYNFNSASNRWISHSPFILSTPNVGSSNVPSGVITTPPPTTNYSVGINKQNPTQALDVAGNSTVSGNSAVGGNLSVTGSFNVTGFPANALVPAGTIVMFHGSSIPAGWVICNGSNGTPDLRGRFIVAAGQSSATTVSGDLNPNYLTNTTGGENKHTLSKSEIPKHFHEANGDGATITATGGNHNHNVTPNGQGTGAQRATGNNGGLASDGAATIGSTYNSHSHPNSEFGGRVGDGTADGLAGQSHENRPLFYVLTFIMKL